MKFSAVSSVKVLIIIWWLSLESTVIESESQCQDLCSINIQIKEMLKINITPLTILVISCPGETLNLSNIL